MLHDRFRLRAVIVGGNHALTNQRHGEAFAKRRMRHRRPIPINATRQHFDGRRSDLRRVSGARSHWMALAALVVLLAGCEDGPGVEREPELHAIEGTWEVVAVSIVHDGIKFELNRDAAVNAGLHSRMEIRDGMFTWRQEGDARIAGTYFIVEEWNTIVVAVGVHGSATARHLPS